MKNIEKFIIEARTETYASSNGFVKSALNGSKQLEYKKGNLLYRDVYYTGKNNFYGIETIFDNDKPVFGMSYYGNWGDMTEQEIDEILRVALISNPKTRLNKEIEWRNKDFVYNCNPDTTDGIKEIGGTETISKNGNQIYIFYYAGGMLV